MRWANPTGRAFRSNQCLRAITGCKKKMLLRFRCIDFFLTPRNGPEALISSAIPFASFLYFSQVRFLVVVVAPRFVLMPPAALPRVSRRGAGMQGVKRSLHPLPSVLRAGKSRVRYAL